MTRCRMPTSAPCASCDHPKGHSTPRSVAFFFYVFHANRTIQSVKNCTLLLLVSCSITIITSFAALMIPAGQGLKSCRILRRQKVKPAQALVAKPTVYPKVKGNIWGTALFEPNCCSNDFTGFNLNGWPYGNKIRATLHS